MRCVDTGDKEYEDSFDKVWELMHAVSDGVGKGERTKKRANTKSQEDENSDYKQSWGDVQSDLDYEGHQQYYSCTREPSVYLWTQDSKIYDLWGSPRVQGRIMLSSGRSVGEGQ